MRRFKEVNREENNLQHIKKAYIELLKVQGVTRIKLNDELCGLRSLLTDLLDQDTQEIQENCEQIALKERFIDRELIEDQNGNTIIFIPVRVL